MAKPILVTPGDAGAVTAPVYLYPAPVAPTPRSAPAAAGGGGSVPLAGGPNARIMFARMADTKKGLLASPFHFQCPPTDSIQWTQAHGYDDYDTVGAGQFTRPGGRQLKSMSVASLFVDYDPPWAAYHYGTSRSLPPVDVPGWIDQLERVLESGTPVAVTIGQPRAWGEWDLKKLPMTLRSLAVEEKAGEPDAKYLTLDLTEWRRLTLARRRRGLPATVTLYQHGDVATWNVGDGTVTMRNPTLAKVAKKLYGDPARWKLIARSAKNRGLKHWTGGRDLQAYARRYGHGKSGARVAKIHCPEAD